MTIEQNLLTVSNSMVFNVHIKVLVLLIMSWELLEKEVYGLHTKVM